MGKRRSQPAEPVEAEIPLGKYLASTEKRVRDRAIRSLAAFVLKSAEETGLSLEATELSKLWKGIFYCFWMSDKPLVQQELALELANLVLMIAGIKLDATGERLERVPSKVDDTARALAALDFFQGFWTTMQSEWHGVDKFRINKYYLLMRRFLHTGLQLLALHAYPSILVQRFNAVMRGTEGPLASNNVRVPDSITYHICDIYLDELEQSIAEMEDTDATVPILDLLSPFMELASTSQSKRMFDRVMASVLTPFLEECEKRSIASGQDRKRRRVESEASEPRYDSIFSHVQVEVDDDEDEDNTMAFLHKQALQRIVATASGSDTYAPSRRKLYDLWKAAQERDVS
ncbi:hypothetical protein MCAP1_003185 [Malassezia caprae]|uniref:Nop52-domain-containing protein n=1 Tax=Malassezia caprae TaxID=1381934 RepID=A0AAF0EAL6_9BASI|nr:hypothetical protein MCAP1_003185 [Malassezia caprae]